MATYRRSTYKRAVSFPTAPRAVAPTYAPSAYQQAILDWLTNGTGNALIEAVAGSGKTSTLVMLANAMPRTSSATFLAFNKSIATELATKLPEHVSASTFHALGFRAIGATLLSRNGGSRAIVDGNKVGNIFDDNFGRELVGCRTAVLKLVSLMKNSALLPTVDDDTLVEIIEHFDIEWSVEEITESDLCDMARKCLVISNDNTRVIDFDDMLYFVHVFGVNPPSYDYIMVDECQDTNEMQRVILRRMMAPNTRLIAVGDSAQAIYGFRGASHDSMQLIRSEFSCTELPLSISYRCPTTVVELAQQFVPHIRARDNAPAGTVLYPEQWKLTDYLSTDLLVCRNTAPLVQVAYKMISRRVPCKIMGREIGKGLTNLIRKVAGTRTTLAQLPEKLTAYMEAEVSAALRRKQDGKAQSISDKCEAILALIESMTPGDRSKGIPGLCDIIDSMFADVSSGVTTLATVHKAKGLEAPRVFILDRKLMPSKYARQQWQLQQEYNLEYVAVTRSLDTLVFLDSECVTE